MSNQMIYSEDSAEEARMLNIRDNPGKRIPLIAQGKIANRIDPLNNTELVWIGDEIRECRRNGIIPGLTPNEYWALIEALYRIRSV